MWLVLNAEQIKLIQKELKMLYTISRYLVVASFAFLAACGGDTVPPTDPIVPAPDPDPTPTVQTTDPSFSTAAGTYSSTVLVNFNTQTGQSIYYTIDGTTPSAAVGNTSGILYSAGVSIVINETATLQAVAARDGFLDSNIVSATYVIDKGQLFAPTASVSSGSYSAGLSVTLNHSNSEGSIYYTTNDTAPSASNGTLYSSAIVLNSTATLRAIVVATSYSNSDELSTAYTIYDSIATPTLSLAGGEYASIQSLSFNSLSDGARFMVTTDGSAPAYHGVSVTGEDFGFGTVYDVGDVLTLDTQTNINVLAFVSGITNLVSDVTSATYTFNYGQLVAPNIDVLPNNPYTNNSNITTSISANDVLSNIIMRYTTTSTNPTETCGIAYTEGQLPSVNLIARDETIEVRAIATHIDYTASAVTSATYVFGSGSSPDPLSVTPIAWAHVTQATFANSIDVFLHAAWESNIYFTTDGTEPTSSSSQYSFGTPLVLSTTTTLKFFAQDNDGVSSAVITNVYTKDATVAGVTIADITNPVGTTTLSGDSIIPIDITFALAGTYSIRRSASPGGQYLTGGTVSAGENVTLYIPLESVAPTNLYLSFNDGINAVSENIAVINLPNVDTLATGPKFDKSPGTYCGAAGVTFTSSFGHELFGVTDIYYTVDGSEPSFVAADSSGLCDTAPYMPEAGKTCVLSNAYQLPVFTVAPPASCTAGVDCDVSFNLRIYSRDAAGMLGTTNVTFNVGK